MQLHVLDFGSTAKDIISACTWSFVSYKLYVRATQDDIRANFITVGRQLAQYDQVAPAFSYQQSNLEAFVPFGEERREETYET
jgi:hypothetical protein